jgi:ABC-type polysaccharide/polyol phosphate export permease
VHFRDLKDVLANLLTFWFFATPIIYPMTMAPGMARTLLNLNPFTHLACLVPGAAVLRWPLRPLALAARAAGGSIALFLFGYFLFDRLRDSFAEEV